MSGLAFGLAGDFGLACDFGLAGAALVDFGLTDAALGLTVGFADFCGAAFFATDFLTTTFAGAAFFAAAFGVTTFFGVLFAAGALAPGFAFADLTGGFAAPRALELVALLGAAGLRAPLFAVEPFVDGAALEEAAARDF